MFGHQCGRSTRRAPVRSSAQVRTSPDIDPAVDHRNFSLSPTDEGGCSTSSLTVASGGTVRVSVVNAEVSGRASLPFHQPLPLVQLVGGHGAGPRHQLRNGGGYERGDYECGGAGALGHEHDRGNGGPVSGTQEGGQPQRAVEPDVGCHSQWLGPRSCPRSPLGRPEGMNSPPVPPALQRW